MSWWGKSDDEEKEKREIGRCNNDNEPIYEGDYYVTGVWGLMYCSHSCKEDWEWKNIGDKR